MHGEEWLAILTPELDAVEVEHPGPIAIAAVYPTLRLGTVLRDDSLAEWERIIIVHGTDPPPEGFGQTVKSGPAALVDGTWQQTWTVESITVAEAKAETRSLAISIYWKKMFEVPTEQEMLNAQADPIQILAARVARFRLKLNEVRTRISAIGDTSPTGVADAYAIYQELEAIA